MNGATSGSHQVDWAQVIFFGALVGAAVVHLIADLKGVPLRRQRRWAVGYVPTLFAALVLFLGLPIVYAVVIFVFGVLVGLTIFGSLERLQDSQRGSEDEKKRRP